METWKIKPVFDRKKKATPEKSANSTALQGRKNGRKQTIVCSGSTVLVKNISSFHKYLYFVSRSKSTVHKSIYIISHEESVVSQQILYIIPIYSHHFFTF